MAEKRAEMQAEEIRGQYHGNATQRRLANERARNYRDAVATPIPPAYDAAIEALRQRDQLREGRR